MNPLLKAKILLDTVYYSMQESILSHEEQIHLVLNLFSDIESKVAYEREIIFKILAPLIGSQYAQILSKSGIDEKTFKELCKKAMNDPNMPKISPQAQGEMNYYSFVCTAYLLQYQYKNIVKIHNDDIVIDCGACFGDTALWFLKNGAKEVYSFEIDKKNLSGIVETLTMNNATDRVHIVPKALGKSIGKIYYNPQGSPGSGFISANQNKGSYLVPMTTIDAYCAETGIHPNFIKMDIEGAEPDAIMGARETLCTYKPDISICLYHRLNHMWEIPLLIKEICPEYKWYCKKCHYQVECVLLATYRGN